MLQSNRAIILMVVWLSLVFVEGLGSGIDIIVDREYEGNYIAKQSGKTFEYLDQRQGQLIAMFYGSPNRQVVNSVELLLLDPKYQDGKAVLIEIKGIIEVNSNKNSWTNSSHTLTYTKIWRQRQGDIVQEDKVNTEIVFQNLDSQDYEEVSIIITMTGNTFQYVAELKYYNQIISTMAYSIYVSAIIAIQIFSAFKILKIMDQPNFAYTAKFSLLTISLCNIQDFSQTMSHIQNIMSSESGYLFFILPSLAYIVIFIIFDMKMLFLIWRSQNIVHMDNPQLIRKKLTAFYIQFYLGLFLYLTLTYFFNNDEWLILLRNLLLIPQIIHNVRLGQKPNFDFYFIFGYIGSRLLIPIYQRSCPQNRFKLTPDSSLVLILLAIYMLQIALLALQYKLGSRFFVPKRFLPNYFEYRLKLKCDEQNRELQCSICLQNIFESSPSSLGQGMALNETIIKDELLGQITIMNTPCNHKFHQQCLTEWMNNKLQCPICRTILPPL